MYKAVLTPTDGSTDAQKGTDHAISLAAAVGATLHLLYVVEEGVNRLGVKPRGFPFLRRALQTPR